MAARLGDVLYWVGCALAAGCLALFAWLGVDDPRPETRTIAFAVGAGGALMIWLFGRACRYVLAGR